MAREAHYFSSRLLFVAVNTTAPLGATLRGPPGMTAREQLFGCRNRREGCRGIAAMCAHKADYALMPRVDFVATFCHPPLISRCPFHC